MTDPRASSRAIELRDARRDDVPRIAEAVARQPLLVAYGSTREALEQSFAGAIDRGEELIVVDDGGHAAGVAWFLRAGTFALGGYLRLIAVFPGREGAGLGGLLLDEVERRTALASRHLFLLVSSGNAGARRFYARRGYVEVGELTAFVRPEIDEVVLWKRLR